MELSELARLRVSTLSLAATMAWMLACGCGGGEVTPFVPSGGSGGGTGATGGTGGLVGNLTVRGKILTPTVAFIDGDTNDPTNPLRGNDLADQSDFQTVGNPAVVGGYLGPIDQRADVEDWYAVTLGAGQGVVLFVPDPVETDFDLYLVDGQLNIVDSSTGTGEVEAIQANAGGEYFVVASACLDESCTTRGPGNYNLIIGTTSIDSIAPRRLSMNHEFVEGEVLISEGDQMRVPKARASDGWRPLTDRVDIRLDVAAPLVARWAVNARPIAAAPKSGRRSAIASIVDWSPTIAAIKELRRSGTQSASPNYIRRAAAIPNDAHYAFQWHYPMIGLEQALDISQGSGVIVAVLDTGIVSAHPDFQGQLVPGYDFISSLEASLDGDGPDANPEDPGDLGQNGSKSTFHGTHVAGTIAARTNDGAGVAGVAGAARIMPVRVLGRYTIGGSTFDICQGMLFAAGLPNSENSGASPAADVINMSLGGGAIGQCELDAVAAARAEGIPIIVAAGNENMNSDNISLAGIDDAFTVSALDLHKQKAPYSNFGSKVDVAAPGGDTGVDDNGDGYPDGVLSTMADDSGELFYDFLDGTSMAAPHVAGVVALMKSVNPGLTPLDLDRLLQGTHSGTSIRVVEDLGSPGRDEVFGFGLINALSAVRAASELNGVTLNEPFIQVAPRSLDLSAVQSSAAVTVQNGGAGALAVNSATTDQAWLEVNPSSGGEGPYQVSANTAGLADGIYLGTVSFASNGGAASVAVRLSIGTATLTGGDLGTVYVLLVDDQYRVVAEAATSQAEGYAYTLPGIPQGTYAVFAGTDIDNDSFIDDLGEAFGGYPTLSEPRFIDVQESIQGVDFGAAYETRLLGPGAATNSAARHPASGRLERGDRFKPAHD